MSNYYHMTDEDTVYLLGCVWSISKINARLMKRACDGVAEAGATTHCDLRISIFLL